ncbi:MAG: hypothetical protein LQ344_005345 [Seirophora lacunosa]|nr:MAG: hypothetical protein LQ344_005345 [Seirophora lacunosa]
MGDPFSAIAGAVSTVDFALRSCNILYDTIRYLKVAPELTQDLQQTVQSIRSILQDLNALVARYRHSQVITAQLQLPDAVSHEINAIKTDLDHLKNRQMNADFYENVLLLSEETGRRHLNTKNELQADIGTLGIGLHDALRAFGQKAQESLTEQGHLKRLLESQHLSLNENQATIMNEIQAVRSSLSDINISNSHIRSATTVNVPTEAAVARVIRAELRRVLKPTIEQCLNTFKANSDDQSRNMLKKLDEMAEYFGQDLSETSRNRSSSASHSRPDAAIDKKCVQDDAGATGMLESAQTDFESSTVPERPEVFLVRRSKHWRRSKVITWAIGTLWVTVSSTHTTSNVSYAGEILQPRTADKDTSYDTFTSMLEPLQSLADDLVENSQEKRYAISTLCLMVDVNPERMESFLDYIQFLKEGGFVLNRISDDGELPLLHNMCTIMLMNRTSIKRYLPEKFQDPLRESSGRMIELATLLLRYGADPCDLNLDGTSPFDIAHFFGLDAEFFEALERAGFDSDKVLDETVQRQRIFDNGGGESTTVDHDDIAPPSTAGLSRRRVFVRERDEE